MSTNSNILREIPTFGSRELLDLHQIIGSGGMGVVSLYEWKIDDLSQSIRKGQKAAVKKLECTRGERPEIKWWKESEVLDIRGVKDEAKILWPRHTQCKYILRMYGLVDAAGVGIVLDFMKYGNIADFFSIIKEAIDLTRIWPLKSRIAQQVCDGMVYLHSCRRPVLHCDLKATNVLLDEKLIVKICDFGLAKIKRLTTRAKSDEVSKEPLVNCPAGTVSHLAPELLRFGKQPTKKSDVYSFGILIWELLTDRKPYEGVSHPFIIINEVLAKKRPDLTVIPSGCPELLKRIMMEAWQQNPGGRPDFSDLRRRLRDVDTRGIEDSVAFTRQIWEERQTRPKELRSRTESQGYFCTQHYSEPRVQEQRVQDQRLNCPVTDPVSDEIFISDDSNDATESIKHVIEDASQPLIEEPSSFTARPRDSTKTFCCKKVTIALLLSLCLWGGAFFVGRYLFPSFAKGCCLDCFDPFDPGMKATCNLPNDSTTAPTGSSCTFSCEDGYILNGNVTKLTCESNGIWSGPLPYCRKIRQCPPLTPPANGGSMRCTAQYYEGSKCAFSCPSGYRLRLPNEFPDDFNITCQSDEVLNYQWSGEEPYCEKVVPCASPTKDPNVVMKCGPPDSINTRQDFANAKDQPYSNGSVCTFSCPSETSLGSNETASVCLDNGKWNITAAVSCINGCPYFDDPPHSEYNCSKKRQYDSKCTFSCSANFVMVGSSIMVCQSKIHKGQWQSGPPQCECPTCRSGKNCENVVAFQKTWDQLNSSAMTTLYDGREIICINKSKVILKKNPDNFAYGCQCRDRKTNINKQCNDDTSRPEACKKAYASLILIMSYSGKCSLPCDAEDMPTAC